MYGLATKRTEKKRVEENANLSFLRQTIRHALVVSHPFIHWPILPECLVTAC